MKNTFTKAQEKQLRKEFAKRMECKIEDVVLAQSYTNGEGEYLEWHETGAYNEHNENIVTIMVGKVRDDNRRTLVII